MGLINLDIISTVVQRSVTGRPVPTGNTIIMQNGADIANIIDKITADLRGKYLSKTIDDEALGMIDFKPGLKIGGIELKYDEENNAVYIERTDGNPVNFYATGGLSMYGLGNTKVTSIMDVIEANIDPNTLGIVNGKLTVIGGGGSGGEGGITAVTKQMVIEALGFTPYSAENPNGYITAASIPSALKNPYALTFGSKTYDGSAAKEITASDLGAALSSDLSKYLPLTGGTINGIINLNHTASKNSRISFKNNRTEESSWADNIINATDASGNVIMRFGIYGKANVLDYVFLGHNTYTKDNLRIYTDKVTFGSNAIWHAGNFNPANYLPLSGGTLTGILKMPNDYTLRWLNNVGADINCMYLSNENKFFIGNGVAEKGYDIYLSGKNLIFRYGTSRTEGVRIDSSGNVGIGTTSPSAKLHVNGTALIGNNVAGGELLRFNMDRPWVFIQEDSGANSKLVLKPLQDTKYFIVKNANNEKLLLCYAVNGGNIVEVGGNIRLDNGKGYYAKDTEGNNISLVGFNSSNQLSIGYGLNSKGYIMGLGGKIVNFYYGTERTLGMVLNESGNVGVAITPEYRFHVEQKTDNTFASVYQTPKSKVYLAHSSGRGIYASVLSGVSTSYLLHLKYNQTTLGSGGSSALYVRTDGNIGIGTESPAYKLAVNGTASVKRLVITDTSSVKQLEFSRVGGNSITTPEGGYFRIITNGKALGDNTADLVVNNGLVTINGNILVTGGTTMYSQRSLKDIVDERGLSLTELSAIKPTRYTWKNNRDGRIHFGGIADDIEKVLPEVIYTTSDGTLTMDYGNAGFAIASSLIKPVIDHETKIRMLEIRVKELEEELKRYSA